eukprot:COSAG06_NODE_304_length_17855_cov_47.399414_14_plen_65_part_00
MLFFGPKLSLPPAEALTADGTKLLLMPFAPNSTTHFKVRKTPLYIYIYINAKNGQFTKTGSGQT